MDPRIKEIEVPVQVDPNIEQPKIGTATITTGRGRKPGTVNIVTRQAHRKLMQLGFDPIQKMVDLYDKITADIAKVEASPKPSMYALGALRAAQQKCVSELLRYGYSRVSESNEVVNKQITPITINLTSKGSTNELPDANDADIEGLALAMPEGGVFVEDEEPTSDGNDDEPLRGPSE
jgi:hypothetical protein